MGGEMRDELRAARAAYERALGDYELTRERKDRVAEFRAAADVDRARRIYFAARDALGASEDVPPVVVRRRARRYRPIVEAERAGTPGGWLRAILNVLLPLVLFAGLALPIGVFAMREAQRAPSLASDTTAFGKAGGAAAARPPALTFARESGERNAPRILDLGFTSDVPLAQSSVILTPDPGVPCEVVLESPTRGRVRCGGALPGGREFSARVTAAALFGGAAAATFEFRTQESLTRLENIKWFTEFEDPTADPLACAAALCRIIQVFTTGRDPSTAYGILTLGRPLNRSRDPGLDPAAIAEVLRRLDGRSLYHYYVYGTREEATHAAIAWLLRSGKPVIALTLGGQHAPLITGFTGEAASPTGIVVVDPQRGDVDPRTAHHRPDKSRAVDYQTGHKLTLAEWYGDEWWLGSPYWSADRNGTSMDRGDGAYPLPHWSGSFVLIADDGDADNPADRMGRVTLR